MLLLLLLVLLLPQPWRNVAHDADSSLTHSPSCTSCSSVSMQTTHALWEMNGLQSKTEGYGQRNKATAPASRSTVMLGCACLDDNCRSSAPTCSSAASC